jgi:hypothetical protein
MAKTIDQAKLKAFLKQVGLIDAKDSGSAKVTAKTSSGTQSVTIKI